MTLRMTNTVEFSIATHGEPSRDPDGRIDWRWRTETPPVFKTTLELEFEKEDLASLRDLVIAAGGNWPYQLDRLT